MNLSSEVASLPIFPAPSNLSMKKLMFVTSFTTNFSFELIAWALGSGEKKLVRK